MAEAHEIVLSGRLDYKRGIYCGWIDPARPHERVLELAIGDRLHADLGLTDYHGAVSFTVALLDGPARAGEETGDGR